MTCYLGEDDVRKTLRGVREHAAPGSVLVADVYGERMLRLGRGRLTKKVLDSTSEGFGFGLSFETDWEQNLRDFLARREPDPGRVVLHGQGARRGTVHCRGRVHRLGVQATQSADGPVGCPG